MTPEQTQSFLADYQALCLKHGACLWATIDRDDRPTMETMAASRAEIIEHIREVAEEDMVSPPPPPETKP